jgi:hypothetical protein
MISFLPESGNTGPAATASLIDGGYRFDSKNGPVAGQYRVLVVRQVADRKHKGGASSDAEARAPAAGSENGAAAAEEWSFTADVSSDELEFDFHAPEEATADASG